MAEENNEKYLKSSRTINNVHVQNKSLSELVTVRKLNRTTLLLLTILITLLFVTYKSLKGPDYNSYKILETYENVPISNNIKTIILWNSFFGRRDWYLNGDTLDETFFIKQNCPITNCLITNNRSYLKSVDQFDAVFFHVAEPFGLNSIPSIRRPEQLYIFFNHESPAHTKHDLSDENNLYNLTASYRLDSDIFWPYGYIKEIETGSLVAPAERPFWKIPPKNFHLNETQMNIIKNKTKLAAWFVSHCGTISKRDDLVKSIQKYMEIDVYGKCGSLKCPQNTNECDKKLDHDYKFYFSFENSLCNDYVTEKLFSKLERFVIPVVFGGADYNRFAPPKSYINAQDFATTEDLASYLLYLSRNDEEYQKYFWWKEHYHISYKRSYCELCSRLNNPSQREKTQYYKNIIEWWYGHSCNQSAHIKFN